MRVIRYFLCMLSLLAPLLASAADAATVVYFPAPESAGDTRLDYSRALLQLAFDKARADYRIEPTRRAMRQSRALVELAQGSGQVHVVASMTSREREEQLLPIRIPIDKGLIGWRVPLVTADHVALLQNVRTAADLAHFTAGQESDWPDTTILRANGLPVVTATAYDSLFKMLAADRFDYFPRSVVEILPEAVRHAGSGIAVETSLALHYPAAVYFFVNRADVRLAEAIRTGLEAAIADGSFDRLFDSHYARVIELTGLARRTVIELDNPLLPAETPLRRREFWWHPGETRRK